MPQQTYASRPRTSDSAGHTAADDDVDQVVAAAKQRGADTIESTDDLLDEIDAILNEEEQFAVRYVQKGGQ